MRGRTALLYKEDAVADLLSKMNMILGVRARYVFNGREIEKITDKIQVASYDYNHIGRPWTPKKYFKQ